MSSSKPPQNGGPEQMHISTTCAVDSAMNNSTVTATTSLTNVTSSGDQKVKNTDSLESTSTAPGGNQIPIAPSEGEDTKNDPVNTEGGPTNLAGSTTSAVPAGSSEGLSGTTNTGKDTNLDTANPGDDAKPPEAAQSGPEHVAEKINPYAYTARGEFTSENFKIEIRNMPRYYGIAQFKKFLQNTLKLSVHKLKPLPGRGAGVFVTLHDEAGRQEALRLLDGREWKKARLTARPAAAVPDPLLAQRQKRRQEDAAGGGDAKRARDAVPLERRVRDAVVPWWDVPYDEQLRRKHAHVTGVLADYKRALRKQNFSLFRWLEKQGCVVEPVRPSPETDHYRNKCEFSVGFHPETGERVVGFRLASYREGSMAVAPLDGLTHVPERMRAAALLFQQHVRESRHAPFNAVTHEGHWRQLLVRTTRGGDLLLSAQFHPQQLDEAELRAARDELRQFMTEGAGAACGATAVLWQTAGRLQAGLERPHELLAGSAHVTETLCGLQLRISPDAFFQVNTAAAEVLYGTVGECAELDADTTLLDVCCGAGSIGLALAGRARAVLGLELVEAAVADARANADRNGIANCKFFAGRAEALLRVLLERGEVAAGRAVAVVDPPRAGLGREVTQTLRRTESLRRVVYVACDLRQALRNLLDLARPESNQYVGYPFVVRRLVPVDLFPQTPHVEVVALLERCDPELWRQMEEAKVPETAEGGQHAAGAEGGGEVTPAGGAEKEAISADDESKEAAIIDSDDRESIPADGAAKEAEPADTDAQPEAPANGEPKEVASANDQPMEAASADT